VGPAIDPVFLELKFLHGSKRLSSPCAVQGHLFYPIRSNRTKSMQGCRPRGCHGHFAVRGKRFGQSLADLADLLHCFHCSLRSLGLPVLKFAERFGLGSRQFILLKTKG